MERSEPHLTSSRYLEPDLFSGMQCSLERSGDASQGISLLLIHILQIGRVTLMELHLHSAPREEDAVTANLFLGAQRRSLFC